MPRHIVLRVSKEEFIEKLAARTEPESFFGLPDSKLVLKTFPNAFKLYPRFHSCMPPVMKASFETSDQELLLTWYFRPTIISILMYVGWFGWAIVGVLMGIIPGLIAIAVGIGHCALMWHFGKPHIKQMEHLITECAK